MSFNTFHIISVKGWRKSVEYWVASEKQWASYTWMDASVRTAEMRKARVNRMRSLRELKSTYRRLRAAVRAD